LVPTALATALAVPPLGPLDLLVLLKSFRDLRRRKLGGDHTYARAGKTWPFSQVHCFRFTVAPVGAGASREDRYVLGGQVCFVSKCSVYATLGVVFWVFVEACNKGVRELAEIRYVFRDRCWRYAIGALRPSESSERLSASPPSAAGACLPASPINLFSDAPSVVLPCGMCALYPADTAKLNKR
jgi:hypothetical protein